MVEKESVCQVHSIFVLKKKKTEIKMTLLLFMFHVKCTKFSKLWFVKIPIDQGKKESCQTLDKRRRSIDKYFSALSSVLSS